MFSPSRSVEYFFQSFLLLVCLVPFRPRVLGPKEKCRKFPFSLEKSPTGRTPPLRPSQRNLKKKVGQKKKEETTNPGWEVPYEATARRQRRGGF